MENYTLQNNISKITRREILGFLTITVLIGLVSSVLSFHHQLAIITSIIGLWVLLIIFPKAKVYTLLTILSGIILLIFLVPGSINLSRVTGLRGDENCSWYRPKWDLSSIILFDFGNIPNQRRYDK